MRSVSFFMLSLTPDGSTVIVQGEVPDLENDGDYSVEEANAAKKLTALGYTVLGSFMQSDPAARLVDLARCPKVFGSEEAKSSRILDVHGMDSPDEDGHCAGDGAFPPFVVVDIDAPGTIAGPFDSRSSAAAHRLAILSGEPPQLDVGALWGYRSANAAKAGAPDRPRQ